MIKHLLENHPLPASMVCAILAISDYYLTIYGARLSRTVKEHLVYEGSYELTPEFQHDIESFKLFSWRFVRRLMISVVLTLVLGWVSVYWIKEPSLFGFLIGGLILLELAIHMRHIHNIATYQYAKRLPNSLQGRIQISRQFSLKLSAVELFSFGMLYLLMFIIQGGLFFLGGVLACWAVGQRHWAMSKKAGPCTQDTS